MDQQNNQSTNVPPAAGPATPSADHTVLMSVLAYLGILIIIPYLMSKNNSVVKFHIKQGLVLVCIEIIVWILGMMMRELYPLFSLINLATLILSVIGIINVIQKNQKPLPLVGKFADNFSI